MLNHPNGHFVYSPSDLIVFMESEFASWMDKYNLVRPGEVQPDETDEALQRLFDRGNRHETTYLERLRADGRDVCTIERKHPDTAAATLAAMRAGREVIYQAYLQLPPFAGYADFLVRVPGTSALGGHHYEAWDTKLARKAKPYFAIQLCCYAEMLEHIQGRRPTEFQIVLGDSSTYRTRTDDCFFYYRSIKEAFLEFHAAFDPDRQPEPEGMRDHRRWASHAGEILERLDHLCRVANVTTLQMKKLRTAGIATMAALAASTLDRVPRMDTAVLDRLRAQANLQVRSDDSLQYELLPPQPGRGLTILPPPSEGDVFFDMEGYPYLEDKLEYLFGACWYEDATLQFTDWWGHDATQEKRAFESFVDWVHARWRQDPRMHIYHYANYEKAALRRLAGRHGTREAEVDDLLRNEVLVDLYNVVRHGVRVGGRDYSIKTLEKIYRGTGRQTEVANAGDSIVAYEKWLESGEPGDWQDSPILCGIRDYNRDDCVSTAELAAWLRARQREAGIPFQAREVAHA